MKRIRHYVLGAPFILLIMVTVLLLYVIRLFVAASPALMRAGDWAMSRLEFMRVSDSK